MVYSATDVASGNTTDYDDDDDDHNSSVAAVTYIYISTGATLFVLFFIFSAGFGWPRMRRVYSPFTIVIWLFLGVLFPPFLFVFLIFALFVSVDVNEDAYVPRATIDVVEEDQTEKPGALSQQERRERARGMGVYTI